MNNEIKTLSFVKVTMVLKDKMKIQGYNKWKVTLNGEERIVTDKIVKFSALTLEEAVKIIVTEELKSININQKFAEYVEPNG